MANAATAQTAIPFGYDRVGDGVLTIPYLISIDTVDTDLTVHSPGDNGFAAIVGLVYQEASAHNLGIKSGSTALVTLERPANDPLIHVLGDGILLVTAKGEDLVIRSSVAISSMLMYVQEMKHLHIR